MHLQWPNRYAIFIAPKDKNNQLTCNSSIFLLASQFIFVWLLVFILFYEGIRVQSLTKGQITMDIDFRWGGDPSIILGVDAVVASLPIQVYFLLISCLNLAPRGNKKCHRTGNGLYLFSFYSFLFYIFFLVSFTTKRWLEGLIPVRTFIEYNLICFAMWCSWKICKCLLWFVLYSNYLKKSPAFLLLLLLSLPM